MNAWEERVVHGTGGNSRHIVLRRATQGRSRNPPSARASAGMVYDLRRRRVVLFGGQGDAADLNDTWAFDGASWNESMPTSSPTARADFGMTYDCGRDRIVLFGGVRAGSQPLSDTWEFDGDTWTRMFPTTSPDARFGASLAYDPGRSVVMMFGGQAPSGPSKELWRYDGATWTQETPASDASPRYYAWPLALGELALGAARYD
ncbi:MAG: hypothetical protein HY303_12740 [Candidatus Wallbacteria bacterium]|nr:hypothetical protein [Candidatus Wallbacteria bacterium]